jgi:dipeptide/tripeptide permease
MNASETRIMNADLAGAIILGVPLYVAAWVLLRRQPRAIFLFAIVLLAVGMGYLAAVGATGSIARKLAPSQFPPVSQPA